MSALDRLAALLGYEPRREAAPAPPAPVNLDAAPGTLTFADWARMGLSGGGVLTEQSALGVSAVYACVQLIAGSVSTMPLEVFRRSGDVRTRVEGHDLWWLLNEQMAPRWSAPVGWEFLIASRLLKGDAFCVIQRASRYSNKITGFEPVHPDRVEVVLDPQTQRLVYRVSADPQASGSAARVLDQDDMLHVPGLGFNGLRGLSPLAHYLRSVVNVATAAQAMSEAFFQNGARPDYAVIAPDHPTEEQIALLRESLNEQHRGVGRAYRPMLLYGGMDVKPLTMPLEDAQMLATRQFQIEEIARVYGVPPFMIGHNEKTTSWGSGVEHMGIGYVRYTLMPHLEKFQTEINRKCFSTPSLMVAFDPSALMEADTKSQFEAFRVALGRAGEPGFMRQNEIRRRLNLPPVDGGDVLFDGGRTSAAQATEDSARQTG